MFEKGILYQTISAIITLLSMIFLYLGGCNNNQLFVLIGFLALGVGTLSPTIIWLSTRNK